MQMCKPVPKMVPTVSCETRMKEIELKEICIDIDIQLPRFSLLAQNVVVVCVVLVRLLRLLLIFVGHDIKWPQLNDYREECKQEEREDCRSTWSKTSSSQHIIRNLSKYLLSIIENTQYESVKLVKTSLNTKVWAPRGDRSAMWADGKTWSLCFHFLK